MRAASARSSASLRLASSREVARRGTALFQHGPGSTEIAAFEQGQRLRSDGGEFWPLAALAGELGAQLKQLIGRIVEAGPKLRLGHSDLAEPCQNGKEGRRSDTPVTRELRDHRGHLLRRRPRVVPALFHGSPTGRLLAVRAAATVLQRRRRLLRQGRQVPQQAKDPRDGKA